MKTAAVLAAVLLLMTGACSTPPTLAPGDTFESNTDIRLTKGDVFDALVEVVYARNIDIDQVDKDAGILTLDPMKITMKQMDRYCEFPAIDTEGRPASNFVDADRNRKEDGKEGLGCTVTMSFLVKRLDDENSNLSVRADWYATNGTDTVQCASRGIFEAEMLNAVKDQLLAPR